MTTPDKSLIIVAEKLVKTFSDHQHNLNIFTDISLQIATGESVAIIGPSGTGKTTLLSLLAGLDSPSSGSIQLLGHPLHSMNESRRAQLRANHISFIFQSFQLLPELDALDNVLLALEIQNHSAARQQAIHWLQQVGLGERLKHKPAQLSGGEQQRVAIARAFATAPQLLFADEPTGNLDEETGAEIIEQLFKLNEQQGTTLVLITHDQQLAKRCSRCLKLNRGTLRELS
ncbi:MAG: ABC transporter ATP-binding protein [Amphritea sp.]